MQFTDQIIDALHQYFEQCSPDPEHPQQITEYTLIQHLQDADIAPFSLLKMHQTHELFQAHFMVRHALYRLQQDYHDKHMFHLVIELTKLTRLPWQESNATGISDQPDTLRQYYLNLNNLLVTTPDDVNTLLRDFWQRYITQDNKVEALRVLGLSVNTDFPTARRRYRQLAQQYHPDKGGNTARFQALQDAMATLERCFEKPKARQH